MDQDRFDGIAKHVGAMTRRALGGTLALGGLGALIGSAFAGSGASAGGKRRKDKNKNKNKRTTHRVQDVPQWPAMPEQRQLRGGLHEERGLLRRQRLQ